MPTIGDVDGSYQLDRQKKCILWQLPLLDSSSPSGMLEFNVASEDVAGFYPIHVSFTTQSLFCNVDVCVVVVKAHCEGAKGFGSSRKRNGVSRRKDHGHGRIHSRLREKKE